MNYSDANIEGTAPFAVAAPLASLGTITVAARLMTALGSWGWINGALNKGRGRLGLNLWDCLGDVLRHGCRNDRSLGGYNLHNSLRLTFTTIAKFLHMRNEETVNRAKVNEILNISSQISMLRGFFMAEVQP